jgi:putative endonuclease
MLANRRNGTIYTGASVDLAHRIHSHREKARPGFTARYGVIRLVWYEPFEMIGDAFQRERTIKHYPRQWKINLIEAENPEWDDLYPTLM